MTDRDLTAKLAAAEAHVADLARQLAITSLAVPLEDELSSRIDEMCQHLATGDGFTYAGIARLLVECQRRMADDWGRIGNETRQRKEVTAQLAQAKDERGQFYNALKNHLCPYDMADWIACGGSHGSEDCDICSEGDNGQHRHALLVRAEAAEVALRRVSELMTTWRDAAKFLDSTSMKRDDCAGWSAGAITLTEDLISICREHVRWSERDGGCHMCGGLPHTTTCFAGRIEKALQAHAHAQAPAAQLGPSPLEIDAAIGAAKRAGWNPDNITLASWIVSRLQAAPAATAPQAEKGEGCEHDWRHYGTTACDGRIVSTFVKCRRCHRVEAVQCPDPPTAAVTSLTQEPHP